MTFRVLGLLLLLATPAFAQQPKSTSEGQKRLQQIRQQRSRLRTELQKLQRQERDVSGQLRNIERQVSTSAVLLRELDSQLQQTEQDIVRTTRELGETRQELERRRELLHTRLRQMYKRGNLETAEVLLSASTFSDLLNRYKYLAIVGERDRSLVGQITELRNQLEQRERRLRRSFLQVQTLRGERLEEHQELRGLESQRKTVLQTVQQRQRATNARLAALARDEKRITNLIATLERRRREAERRAAAAARAAGSGSTRAPRAAATLSTRDIGNLGWPVDGRVLYRFGREVQPNGTAIRRNGIGIGAPVGSAVRSVEAGTVVLAQPFEGYGPSVILSHGGGYYSLYLYLNSVSVSEGATVTRGQQVGTVGGQGTPEGAHVEFQIRTPGGPATDPLGWLRKRAG